MQQSGLHQTYIEGRPVGALEHHWYPTAVRIKRGALPSLWIGFHFEAGSVSTADRRGADRGVGFTANSSRKKGTGMQDHSKRRNRGICAPVSLWQSDRCRFLTSILIKHLPVVFQLGQGSLSIPSRFSSYCFKEPFGIKRGPPLEHRVDSTSKLLGDDRQRLGFAVAADQSHVIELSALVSPQE